MKRVIKKTALWIILAALFIACNKSFEDKSEQGLAALQVTLSNFKENAGTRAQESGYQTSFTSGDRIGVFALKNSGNVILENNIPYTYNGTSWQPANASNEIHIYGSGITYYAYYPYSSNMDGKKIIAEIITAFTPAQDQSDYTKYTSADLMTATGTLSGSTLSLAFTHAMSLIEIDIEETTNSTAPYDPAPVFHNMNPWKTPDGIYRYLIRPGIATEVAFDYGPTDNRYAYQKSLTAAEITAGNYTRVKAPFRNWCVELNTGNYAAILGPVSKVIINGTEYAATAASGSNNKYIVEGLRKIPESFTSFDVYITDNLAKADSKEQLLLSANTANLSADATASTITMSLSAGGMEGAGTSDADPYRVTTPPQLRGVAAEGTENDNAETEYYEQTKDLDLTMYADWKPVKSGKLYDGKGFKVTNLNSTQGGIFSNNGGTIQSVHLAAGNITVGGHAGGIVNYSRLSGSKVIGCSNAATVTGGSGGEISAGGIVGNIYWGGAVHIIDCKNTGSITGSLAGGILGDAVNGDNRIYCCYNEGVIKSTGDASGGIVGRCWFITQYCYNIGAITGNSSGAITGIATGDIRTSQCWASSTPFTGSGNISCEQFDNTNNKWPMYTTDASDTYSWGSSHWKSYSQGEYPKLLWEP